MGQCFPTNNNRPVRTAAIVNSRWLVKSQIGKGGFGSVYLVEDLLENNAERAMKTETIKCVGSAGKLFGL